MEGRQTHMDPQARCLSAWEIINHWYLFKMDISSMVDTRLALWP